FIRRGTRHDQERHRLAIAAAESAYFLGMDLKQALARYRADREHPLGMIESQPCPLAASNHEDRHFTALQRFFPTLPGATVARIQPSYGDRLDALGLRYRKDGLALVVELADLIQVQRPHLVEQFPALLVVQTIRPAVGMGLSR